MGTMSRRRCRARDEGVVLGRRLTLARPPSTSICIAKSPRYRDCRSRRERTSFPATMPETYCVTAACEMAETSCSSTYRLAMGSSSICGLHCRPIQPLACPLVRSTGLALVSSRDTANALAGLPESLRADVAE